MSLKHGNNCMACFRVFFLNATIQGFKKCCGITMIHVHDKPCCFLFTLSFLNTNPKRFAVSAKYSSLDHHLSLSLTAGRGFQPRFLLRSSPLSSMMTHQSCFAFVLLTDIVLWYRTAGCAGIDILQPWQHIFSRKASKDTGVKNGIKQSYGCNIDLCIMWLNVPLWLLICSE